MTEWNDHHSWGSGWGWFVMVVMLLLVVAVTVLLVRHFNDGGRARNRNAHDVLADRFARGDIDEEEYRKRRDALRS
jgi:putative membrane protein